MNVVNYIAVSAKRQLIVKDFLYFHTCCGKPKVHSRAICGAENGMEWTTNNDFAISQISLLNISLWFCSNCNLTNLPCNTHTSTSYFETIIGYSPNVAFERSWSQLVIYAQFHISLWVNWTLHLCTELYYWVNKTVFK